MHITFDLRQDHRGIWQWKVTRTGDGGVAYTYGATRTKWGARRQVRRYIKLHKLALL